MKWIASFPGNVDRGVPRASAVVVLNRLDTGQPEVLLEGSVISARRTGASAALAARELAGQPGADAVTGASFVGGGVINFEVLRYLRHTLAGLREVTVYDLDPARAEDFAARCTGQWPDLVVECARSVDETMARHPVISVATTAARPYLNLDACAQGAVVLHVSLRDLTVDAVLSADNVVDDADHVCREQTSLHLAEQVVGHRGFIRAGIGDILLGNGPAAPEPGRVTVFSPFGLGVLDLALARLVRSVAQRDGRGVPVPNFLG
jgi:ornithine cyclodeaminase